MSRCLSLRFIVLVVCGFAVCGCLGDDSSPAPRPRPANEPLQVLATTGMIADTARQIGQSHVAVTALMGPGVDPHLYQPTPRDNSALRKADLVLYNGLHLEGRMAEHLESLARSRPVVAVSRDIPHERLLALQAGAHDPHVWLDVGLWTIVARTIGDSLAASDPEHAPDYQAATAVYCRELEALETWCQEQAERVPKPQRVLITSHDAFHYFGRAYGFEVLGIQGISTESEAGLKAITDTVDLIRARGVKAIFPETSVPRAAIERVARDSGAVLGPELYSDALGPVGSPAESYTGMIRANMRSIVEALLGTTAEATR